MNQRFGRLARLPQPQTCPGPLVWFDVAEEGEFPAAAILECAACRFVIVTGNFYDQTHAGTPLMREGFAR